MVYFVMIRKSAKYIIIIIIISFILAGCSNSEFYNDYESFKSSYLKVTDVLDPKNPLTSIEKLNTEPILMELQKLKSIVSNMKEEASTKYEKATLRNISSDYEGLEFLLYATKNIDNLSEDERGRIASEITSIQMHRSSIIGDEE